MPEDLSLRASIVLHPGTADTLLDVGLLNSMKNMLTIILVSGLLLCGCSSKHNASAGSDVDSIQPGKDISCWDGSTLRITKRVGTSVEGATITVKPPNGLTQTFSAETATLSYSTNRITGKSLIITLHDANAVFGSETAFVGEFEHPIYLGK
jgi:hypothetical protein